ncbi:MAG: insulinase family protein [Anaeromyxobacter sp.]|nr:insulinase family protein [Anaeromyxobacter sp.]
MSLPPRWAAPLLAVGLSLATAPALAAPAPVPTTDAPSPSAGPAPARQASAVAPLPLVSFALPNGLAVTLAPDHRVPRVVVDTWFGVGSKDEAAGRAGFAHLFEHLMFMGTARVPGNKFDVLMEQGGGANNASTSEDRTNYYSFGPASLLPTLLWLDADRLDALGAAMTTEKLDLQRSVVRNERRQTVENTPYALAELVIPEAMYPAGHPYHHSVIGSHEDLEAATLADVVGFFDAHYVPANGSLVVAGDFDPAVVRPLVERLFGAVPTRPHVAAPMPPPARLEGEVRRVVVDRVELARLELLWHAPPAYAPGTAELELLGRVLADGASSRLVKRLVHELRLAEAVEAGLEPRVLGSLFRVQVTAVPGADLERVKREVRAVLAGLAANGPGPAELARARARDEVALRATREDLLRRADKLNEYRFFLGTPDGFAADLARAAAVTPASVRQATRALGDGHLDLRILPRVEGAAPLPATAPADLPAPALAPPPVAAFTLPSGLEVRALRLPGSGLFAGHLAFPGAERAVPPPQAGLSALLAQLLTSGAGGRDAAAFAEAAATLGAEVSAEVEQGALVVSVQGLSRHLEPTIDLLADAVLRPTLAPSDFAREKALLAARVDARASEPREVAALVAGAALFGEGDPRGRPAEGFAGTVAGLSLAGVKAAAPSLLHPRGAVLVLAGDFDPAALRAALTRRFGGWRPAAAPPPPAPAPATSAASPVRVWLVDRPGAPQTRILAVRPLPPLAGAARAARQLADVALGGGFTSRLNQNLREKHGYTYGVRSGVGERDGQVLLSVGTAVQTEVTGAALGELRRELDGLTAGGLLPHEAAKARETSRSDVAARLGTSTGLSGALLEMALAGRPATALADEVAALDQATAAQADAQARGGAFAFDGLTLVLVGDRAAVTAQLGPAGLPAPTVVDAEGKPAR